MSSGDRGLAADSARTTHTPAESLQADLTADFDGDGFADLAVGVFEEAVGSIYNAGAVKFDSDGFADLAVGVPIESIGSIIESGAVSVLPGSAARLTGSGSQFFTQNTTGVGSTAEEDDYLGYALSVGDFDNDGSADLAVGVPFEDIGSIVNTGAVNVLPGSATGLTGTGSQFFTQDTAGGGSSAEEFDLFGFALAASGAPGPTAATPAATPQSHTLRTRRASLTLRGLAEAEKPNGGPTGRQRRHHHRPGPIGRAPRPHPAGRGKVRVNASRMVRPQRGICG